MVGLARYALKSPLHAFSIVGLLAVASLIVPFISFLSGAFVSLIILTQGLQSGLKVIVWSVIATSIMTWVSWGSPLIGLTVGLVQWLPMVVLAELLRRTQSLSMVIIVGMALAIVAVVVQFMLWPNLDQFWKAWFEEVIKQSDQPAAFAELKPMMNQFIHWMVLFFIAAMYSSYIATLMLGRWFQAKIVGSDGYKKEFYAIFMGKPSALIGLLLIALSILFKQDILVAIALVVAAGFIYQGLAVVHVKLASTKPFFIGLYYFLLFLLPQIVALTALLGIIDNWFQFRDSGGKTPKSV